MTKLFVLFKKPKDPARFDDYYWRAHTPLAKKMPGLKRLAVHRVVGAPRGEPDLYQIVELEFENRTALDAALASPEGRESGRDARNLETEMTFLFCETKEA